MIRKLFFAFGISLLLVGSAFAQTNVNTHMYRNDSTLNITDDLNTWTIIGKSGLLDTSETYTVGKYVNFTSSFDLTGVHATSDSINFVIVAEVSLDNSTWFIYDSSADFTIADTNYIVKKWTLPPCAYVRFIARARGAHDAGYGWYMGMKTFMQQ